VQRGLAYLERAASAREKIGKLTSEFIQEGSTILTHGYSRVVSHVLRAAANSRQAGKIDDRRQSPFRVLVTESLPDRSGERTVKELRESGIDATLILDAAVAYVLERCDLVLIGAESVVENGGVVNKVGTFGVCLCAHSLNRPVYVCAESFKFVRLYPLSQSDLPALYRFPFSKYGESLLKNQVPPEAHPLVDYTPPQYVTLLFTDLGILTPTAVSDELIKLYV
jgi:translation initiation factor eIF-2B subunit alpha